MTSQIATFFQFQVCLNVTQAKRTTSLLLFNHFYPATSCADLFERKGKRRIIAYSGSVTRYGPQSVANVIKRKKEHQRAYSLLPLCITTRDYRALKWENYDSNSNANGMRKDLSFNYANKSRCESSISARFPVFAEHRRSRSNEQFRMQDYSRSKPERSVLLAACAKIARGFNALAVRPPGYSIPQHIPSYGFRFV